MSKEFKSQLLVQANSEISDMKYKVLENIQELEKGCRCIIVKALNPDYYLLFNNIKAIITENGSPLSHLAIAAREHNIPVFLAENIISNIPKKGEISIRGDIIEIK